jgi:hypothetical protein
LILQEEKDRKMELNDHGLERLVKDEIPKQILALTFEQQFGRILEGSTSLDLKMTSIKIGSGGSTLMNIQRK